MEYVEYHFTDEDGKEQVRKYEVDVFSMAHDMWVKEFPDEKTRPCVFRIQTTSNKALQQPNFGV